jgi:hypothetical protein
MLKTLAIVPLHQKMELVVSGVYAVPSLHPASHAPKLENSHLVFLNANGAQIVPKAFK